MVLPVCLCGFLDFRLRWQPGDQGGGHVLFWLSLGSGVHISNESRSHQVTQDVNCPWNTTVSLSLSLAGSVTLLWLPSSKVPQPLSLYQTSKYNTAQNVLFSTGILCLVSHYVEDALAIDNPVESVSSSVTLYTVTSINDRDKAVNHM